MCYNNLHEWYNNISSCKLYIISCIDGRISENTIIFQRVLSFHTLTFKCVENSSFASSFYAVKGADQSEIITTLMKIISTNDYMKPLKA